MKHIEIGLVMLLLLSVILAGCSSKPKANLDSFAQCITDKGYKMYGSMTCSACASTKKFLGSSMEFIDEVECHPKGPDSQTERCLEIGVKYTPDWVLEKDGEVMKRSDGYLTLAQLSEFTGCPLP